MGRGVRRVTSLETDRRRLLRGAAGVLLGVLWPRVAAAQAPAPAGEMPYWAAQAALAYPGPAREQPGEKEVLVSLGAQRLWAFEGERPVLSSLVSTGTAETPEVTTPLGHWRILVKLPVETMEGTVAGEAYRVEDVPDVMYFTDEGHALHGTYWHDNFGTPMSHGCVNLPLDVAAWMYDWAPEGTAVSVVP